MWWLILIKQFIFWAILGFFGWQLACFLFQERHRELLIPLSFGFGVIIYLFLLNSLGYIFAISKLFFIVLIFLFLSAFFLFLANRGQTKTGWLLGLKWRRIFLIITVFIFLSTGLIAARGYTGDELNVFSTVPMAANIAAGGFPVYWTVNPTVKAYYHYGVELFTAAMFKTTGLPLWFGVDVCRAVFTTLFFMLLFAILLKIIKRPAKTLLVALMTLYGGGFVFIYLFNGLIVGYKIFVQHLKITAPWKFLHLGTTAGVAGPLIKDIHIQYVAPAFLLIVISVWLYYQIIQRLKEKQFVSAGGILILNIISLSVLTLVAETYLLVVLLAFLFYPLVLYFLNKNERPFLKFYLLAAAFILVLSLLIAILQGGVLTELFKQHYSRQPRISYNWFYYSYEKVGYLWSQKSIINFGLPLLLFIPSLYLFLTKFKKTEYYNEIGQIILISLGCFAVPFVIVLGPLYDYEMARYLYLAPPFWSMLLGLVIVEIFLNHSLKRPAKYLINLIIVLVVLNGILFQLIFMLIPLGRSAQRFSPFFFNYPQPSPTERAAYNWIKAHTSVKDIFLTYSASDNFSEHNKKLIIFTGRVAPQYDYLDHHRFMNWDSQTKKLVKTYRQLKQSCQPEQLKELNYKYLYVNQYWPPGLAEKCLAHNNLKLVFEQQSTGGQEFAKIYKINFN